MRLSSVVMLQWNAGGYVAEADKRERSWGGSGIPDWRVTKQLCCPLHAECRRPDRAAVWWRHESRLWRSH